MIFHRDIYNPIEKMEEMKPEVFNYYIDICNRQKKGEQTDAGMMEEIRHIFYSSHPKTLKANLDIVWGRVSPKIESNVGLAQFILDFGGAESDYFFPWLITVWTSPSAALEMAYGAGYDLTSEWHERIPEDDRISYFVHNVPTFVYNRERQCKVADLAMVTLNKYDFGEKSKVIDLGAGRMAWARYHGFTFGGPYRQKIYAFDKDATIEPEALFPFHDLEKIGLEYRHSDFLKEMHNPNLKKADLVILGGVASYFPLDIFVEMVVKPVYGMLKRGGCFFFDLQLDCPQYVWSVKLFDWPEIKLMKSPSEAIDTVEAIRRALWDEGMKMGADYALDTYNEVASSVMVMLTKV